MADLTEVCALCRNYFVPKSKRDDGSYMHSGTFTIENHTIVPLDFLLEGQYFRIIGSVLNDGVYCNNADGMKALANETFIGTICEMAVPRTFVKLCEDIAAWRDANESLTSKNMSPFSSESVSGVYSYSKGAGSGAGGGTAVTWQGQFAARIAAFRRVYE